ncbi:MAG: hypothetical protein JWQ96_1657 [Segetibacter sp.]|nr:hypothetical protein [Segetibacter sp.]
MKKVSNWFEVIVENAFERKQKGATLLMVLVVLFIGAGSLYMLLKTPG